MSGAGHLELGRAGEDAAARYLERRQCRILCRNVRTAAGELDLVVRDGAALVFVEVKSLREKAGFAPAGNLSRAQMLRNRRAGELYRAMLTRPVAVWRYDLIEVVFRGRRVVELRRRRDYLPGGGSGLLTETLARRPFWGYII
ncbi:MAG: YraN family protein [Lentisphaeria bacterium]|nr:YraN family protein [Lentisphaeria bacterium]